LTQTPFFFQKKKDSDLTTEIKEIGERKLTLQKELITLLEQKAELLKQKNKADKNVKTARKLVKSSQKASSSKKKTEGSPILQSFRVYPIRAPIGKNCIDLHERGSAMLA